MTYPNGTTIEFGDDAHGNQVHRVCNAGKSICRYVEPWHCAACYAEQFEEYYPVVPDKYRGETESH